VIFVKKIVRILTLAILILALSSFGALAAENKKLIVGATPFPHAEILKIAAPLLKADGYDLEIKEFNDYVTPNIALNDGSLAANFFQHVPYLENQSAEQKLDITWVAKVHIEPLGLYSKKIKTLGEITDGVSVAIPNDPTNGARALRLLEKAGLIKVKEGDLVTARDITENTKNLKIVELEAATLPRTLDDTIASVINTNYAVEAGLIPARDAITIEDKDSPYANVLAVRKADTDTPATKALVKAINSPEVKKYIEDELVPKGIVAAF
jgi:D-methionine transport system substrate-binding protein